MPTFADVKAVLDKSLEGWRLRVGTPAQVGLHSDDFGWATKAQLLAATAFGLRLIDPSIIGNGSGDKSNLVLALKTGVPRKIGFWPRMPRGGPFLSDAEIQAVQDWIDAGVPD